MKAITEAAAAVSQAANEYAKAANECRATRARLTDWTRALERQEQLEAEAKAKLDAAIRELTEASKCAAEWNAHLYQFLALAEEAGEVAGKIAKAIRKGEPADVAALLKELGDVQWQLAACASELCAPLSRVVGGNLDKLAARDAAGTIVGEGDDR